MTLPRSDHFNGKTFFQPHHGYAGRFRDLLRWKLCGNRPRPWPKRVPFAPPAPLKKPAPGGLVATWIGHATFLLQTSRANLLFDPVFSDRASPVSWAGPQRVHPPGVAFAELPPIHAVLLSHDHYDHLDLPSLRALSREHDPTFITPLRHADLLNQAGARRIVELDWWQSHALGADLNVTLTPSKHWSNRFGSPRNHRLWGGFAVQQGAKRVWYVGDSGYDAEIFREVRRRCGPPDLALVPIGAYEPRWFMEPMHMNPAEAVRLHLEVGARLSLAMHWGTFQLTDEGRDEPVATLAAALDANGVPRDAFRAVAPGESVAI
jgi:L-ascorbate metabolism protein UlaG (beta-lactamase superfamily)